MKQTIVAILSLILCCFACKQKKQKQTNRDTSINQNTSFNNLFFDSTEIDKFLNADSSFSKYKEQFHEFYRERNYEFAWFDNNGLAEQAHHFYNLLNSAVAEFQDSSFLNEKMLNSYHHFLNFSIKKAKQQEVVATELLITGQFFNYAAKMYKGIDVDASELGWFIPRKKVNLSALLDSVIKAKTNLAEVYVPFNSQYKKLQEQLQFYNQLQKIYPEDTIAKPAKPIVKGDSSSIISAIKQRLFLLKDLDKNDSINKFDTTLQKAVKLFQRRFGLPITASITSKFIDELNIPIKQRIATILINIERARWLPAEKDSNYILVNIPEYKLHVFDSTINTWDMNVIVGKTATSTVIFNGNLKYIVFSPYWNVPSTIVKNEILPGIKKDKNYLEKTIWSNMAKAIVCPLFVKNLDPKTRWDW